jgi:L-seryl-tRNA(Ser) seleniumtransferase
VGAGDDTSDLRSLPAVHELAGTLDAPPGLAADAARQAIDEARAAIRAGAPVGDLSTRAQELLRPPLRRVLNATGVIVHTNLGRAPLSRAARDAAASAATGYSNLELDLATGSRGSRHAHVERLLAELTGAEAGLAVNNGAAAVLLATATLAGPGRAVIVSRGQLVEIGGGFRIPDVVAQSGSELVEVGTTNRTRLADYAGALEAHPGATILRVHQSNFRALGFVQDVPIEELCSLGASVIDDIGSGVLAGASGLPALGEEPPLRRSVAAGAALVCCSGDKLLGGPQAGLIVGRGESAAAARAHPLARALRLDKLSLAALAATLRLYRDPALARAEIPVLAMLDADEQALLRRAERIHDAIGADDAELIRATAKVGGGALPLLELEGPAVALTSAEPQRLAAALRAGDPPVIGRIHDGRLLLDPRTLTDDEVVDLTRAATAALAGG